jgi:hypothetical protein
MAKKKTTEEAPEVVAAPVVKAPTPPAKPKIPKLAAKNKSRLPRKQKKALKKAEK